MRLVHRWSIAVDYFNASKSTHLEKIHENPHSQGPIIKIGPFDANRHHESTKYFLQKLIEISHQLSVYPLKGKVTI